MGYSDIETEKRLVSLEKKLKKEYKKAYKEIEEKSKAYFERYKERYEEQYAEYMAGKYTDLEFINWTKAQVARGDRWEKLKDELAWKMTHTNEIAAAYVNGSTPGIYALNANYEAYRISKAFDTSFTLVNEEAVKNLVTEDGNYTEFKTLRVNPIRDYAWNSKQIESALLAGIVQGQGIKELSQSFLNVMGRNQNAAIRNARTAYTSAQNGGRLKTMDKAADMGINLKKEWVSARDGRVRDSHAHINGQIKPYKVKFDNGLMYPGDSAGRPEEVYNCRCSVVTVLPDYEDDTSKDDYQEWLKTKGK